MQTLICEYCRNSFERKKVARFCSAKCRYRGLAAQGIRPVHNAPHSEAAKAKIRGKRERQVVWNAGKTTGIVPWNKGLTSETSELVRAAAQKMSTAARGKKRGPLSAEVKRKLSDGRKGDANWAKRDEVRKKISESITRLYREHPELLEGRKRAGRNQFPGNFSSLEAAIAACLDRVGVPYMHNSKVGKYWPDFIIQDRVIIECDGDYWHQDEEKDRRRDAYLTTRGFFVFHLREAEIIADPMECIRRVLRLYEPFAELAV